MPREAGIIIVSGEEVASTLQCCHCNKHFISIKGSGKIRGFCQKCGSVTCGDLRCMPCLNFEKKLDLIESGKLSLSEL